MKRIANSFLLFAALVVASLGCKKSNTNTFALDNRLGTMPLNVVVYTSKSDFVNKTNALVTETIDSGKSFSFPSSYLNPGNWYYVDVYSSDYGYNNWGYGDNNIAGEDSASGVRFKYNGSDNRYVIRTQPSMARRVFLSNTGTGSRWRAFGALDINDGTDKWGTLTAQQQNLEILVNKDYTGEYRYINGAIADTFRFSFQHTPVAGFPIFRLTPDNNTPGTYIENANLNALINSDRHATTDTVLSVFNGSMYLLSRE